MPSAWGQYVPTSEEMKDAVAVALNNINNKKPTAKELQYNLECDNPTWKLPERRVNKFLKRELKNQGVAPESSPFGNEDDDESLVSTASRARELARSTVGSLKKVVVTPGKKLFSFRKKKQQKQAASNIDVPPMIISAHSIIEEPQVKVPPVVVEEPAALVVEEKPAAIKPKELELNKYEDDNDGEKDNQLCADTCVIL
mmetsp:Transcript_25342/g.42095  ORF Transcript_25342/g.42095 Transcript_25342/m.42095 type:complete len:199 (+) Transcript_25342:2548-3144(+)